MTLVNNYLFFDGACGEAMTFYQKVFGGKLDLIANRDAPPESRAPGAENENRIMHARLVMDGGGTLMASDWLAGQKFPGASGFAVAVAYDSAEEGRRVFEQLAEGGTISMPYGKTFWADGFGMVADRFGTPWMVNGGMHSVQ